MGEYDFTYEIPDNFKSRVIQYTQQQVGGAVIAKAFQACSYDYDDQGLAYYAGIKKGDNWNKHALDFTFEGPEKEIELLKRNSSILESAISTALRPSISGYLLRKTIFFVSDAPSNILPISNEERLIIDVASANAILADLVKIGERVCSNYSYNAKSTENSINDYFRDALSLMGYNEVKDQTRHGVSQSGKDAAEVDMLVTKDGKEIAIFEGLKLDYVNSGYIDTHIKKAITNYNALGTATFIVAYVTAKNFESFWKNYLGHIQAFSFPLVVKKGLTLLAHPNASTRGAMMILSRDGFDFPAYFIALKIC